MTRFCDEYRKGDRQNKVEGGWLIMLLAVREALQNMY